MFFLAEYILCSTIHCVKKTTWWRWQTFFKDGSVHLAAVQCTHECDVYQIRSALKRNNTLTGESLACPNIGKTWVFQWHISRLSLRVSNGEHAISLMMNWSISDISSCRSRQRYAWVELSFFFIICLVKFITSVWYRFFTDMDIKCIITKV